MLAEITRKAIGGIGRAFAFKQGIDQHDYRTGWDKAGIPPEESNLVLSLLPKGRNLPPHDDYANMKDMTHAPTLDLDLTAHLWPSTTPGNFHLFIDVEVPHETYMRVLDVLAEAGILEREYAAVSIMSGCSAVRTPGVQREPHEFSDTGSVHICDDGCDPCSHEPSCFVCGKPQEHRYHGKASR